MAQVREICFSRLLSNFSTTHVFCDDIIENDMSYYLMFFSFPSCLFQICKLYFFFSEDSFLERCVCTTSHFSVISFHLGCHSNL